MMGIFGLSLDLTALLTLEERQNRGEQGDSPLLPPSFSPFQILGDNLAAAREGAALGARTQRLQGGDGPATGDNGLIHCGDTEPELQVCKNKQGWS